MVVWRLDRLGRSLPHLIELVAEFGERGVHFTSLSESIDTSNAGGELIFHMLGALAQFERSLISERTKAGLASAKARGSLLGRPKRLSPQQVAHAKDLVSQCRAKREVARLFKVSPGDNLSGAVRNYAFPPSGGIAYSRPTVPKKGGRGSRSARQHVWQGPKADVQ